MKTGIIVVLGCPNRGGGEGKGRKGKMGKKTRKSKKNRTLEKKWAKKPGRAKKRNLEKIGKKKHGRAKTMDIRKNKIGKKHEKNMFNNF